MAPELAVGAALEGRVGASVGVSFPVLKRNTLSFLPASPLAYLTGGE